MKNIIKTLLLGSLVIGAVTGCEFGGKSKPESSRSEPNSEISSSVFSSSSSEQESSSSNTSSKESSLPSSSSNSSSSASSKESSSSAASSSSSAASSSSSSSLSIPPLPQSLTLGTWAVKKTYDQGEALDLTNLIVNVNYKDGTTKTITNYTSNPADGTILNDLGEQQVTISYLTLSKSFTITVNEAIKRNWTAEESKLMSDNLNGVVLPYTGSEDSVVSYDADYETIYIKGGKLTESQMSDFNDAMSLLGFSLQYDLSTENYLFSKSVSYNNETRTVKGLYYGDENQDFYLEAYDPYYYNFPSAIIQKVIKDSLYSDDILPAFSADRYQTDINNGAVYCYTSSTTSEADYTAVLQEAGWDISQGYDAVNNFYMAVSPNEEYMVYYRYEDAPYNSLDIYVMPINYWNDKPIKAFYQKYTDFTVNIPHLDIANAGYLFRNSDINDAAYEHGAIELIHSFLYIYGAKKTDLEDYVDTLDVDGWDISGGGTLYKALKELEGRGYIRIEAEYSSVYSAVIITFYAMLEPYPVAGWPYDEIATILTADVTDTLPAFEGENNGFSLINDMWGTSITINVEAGTENAALASYQSTLEKNGYVQNGAIGSDPIYISKNNQIWANPYKGGTGFVTIDFKMMPNIWPKTAIANALKDLFGNITETVPAYLGAEGYSVEKNNKELYVIITLPSGKTPAAAQNEYVNILKNNDFKEIGLDADDDMHYSSKGGQLDICPYVDGSKLVLYIVSLLGEEAWPSTAINAWLSARNFNDELPEYNGNYLSATIDEEDGFSVVITLDNPSNDDIEDAMDLYCYTLFQETFSHTDTLPFGLGEEYTSPNNEFTVVVSPNDDGFELILDSAAVDPVTGAEFPMDKVLEVFPQANGVIPSFGGGISYEFEGYTGEGWCGIMVTFEDRATAEAKMTEYIGLLTTASFNAQSVWYGNYTGYFSPDGTFTVLLTEYYDQNAIYIDVYDPDIAYF